MKYAGKLLLSRARGHNAYVSIALAEGSLCVTFHLRSPTCYILGMMPVVSKVAIM